MPFGIVREKELDGYQLFAIDISNVDRDHDRLAVISTENDEVQTVLFSLTEDTTGKPMLCLDCENSDQLPVREIRQGLREGLDIKNPEDVAIYMTTDTLTDSTELMLTMPPTLEISLDDDEFFAEAETSDDEVITLESRTIN